VFNLELEGSFNVNNNDRDCDIQTEVTLKIGEETKEIEARATNLSSLVTQYDTTSRTTQREEHTNIIGGKHRGKETPTRIKNLVLCKSGEPHLDVGLHATALSKPYVFVRNKTSISPLPEPPDNKMRAAASISTKPSHHSHHIELEELHVDWVQFRFYHKSYDKILIMCAIFEQWDPGSHLDVLTRKRSSHFTQWDPGGCLLFIGGVNMQRKLFSR
jgi:hypothetical protein